MTPTQHWRRSVQIKYKFTYREMDVVQRLCEGLDQQQIANELFIDIRTVKFHCMNIYQKAGLVGPRYYRKVGQLLVLLGVPFGGFKRDERKTENADSGRHLQPNSGNEHFNLPVGSSSVSEEKIP